MIRYTEKDSHNDFQWFIKHYDDFYKKYGRCYIAIRHQEILGVFDNQTEGVAEISKIYPLGTFLVQPCSGNASEYTAYIASPEIARMMLGLNT